MDQLEPSQVEILGQLQAISGGADADVMISVLASVEWDIQKAAELILDGDISHNNPAPPPVEVEAFEVDDSLVSVNSPRRPRRDSRSHGVARTRTFWDTFVSIFTLPIHFLSSLLRFALGTLRIPFPSLHFTGISPYRTARPIASDPRSAADRWIRAVEEETGAVCVNGSRSLPAIASGAQAGPSTIRRNTYAAENGEDNAKTLPQFFSGSYEEVLDICQRDARIACIILVSDEHDDVPEFKRSTLTDPTLVKTLCENSFVVWGGDVRDRDAWSAAQKLQATTYPFVAFLALQPRRNHLSSSHSNSSPVLTTLSRHQGRSVPDTAPTSAHSLVEHLEQQLLPRVTPFLTRHRTMIQERERDRILREEQDRAFKDSARRDRERQESRENAKREETERLIKEQQEIREREERQRLEQERQEKKKEVRMDWRRWMRSSLIPSMGPATTGSAVRIAVRLPNNERVVRVFSPMSTLTALYAFADSKLIPTDILLSDDPKHAPATDVNDLRGLEAYIGQQPEHSDAWWGFKLALAYPRREIKWEAAKCLRDVDGLQDGSQVVVELGSGKARPQSNDASDDEYDTESD
ncbi:hypothetical protein BJ138DRAFT_1070633 [Hygrophoropsis aurantiaca]|uniref:Uncharacterized protein n=1 Tax=Hygrophoropsis aurantiaca TaxID=72124 RepID=A0ACB8A1I9_9AGAM|nr:hypothetical protein BJ138DRAFT_1070633 [Hygrophoropsis aurantiaca]